MNKVLFLLVAFLMFSCNKEKRSDKYLAGDWDIVEYSEVIFDGTMNKYNLLSGEAHFDKLKGNSEANFQLSFKAIRNLDTLEKVLNGTYKRRTIDTLDFNLDTISYVFEISRIFKTDLNTQGGLAPDRKSIFIMKKK